MKAKHVMGSAALMAALPMILDFLRPRANAGREDRIYSVIGLLLRGHQTWLPDELVGRASEIVLSVERKLAELEKRDDDEQLERIRNAHRPSECCYEGCDQQRKGDTLFCEAHQVNPGEVWSMSREEWERGLDHRCEVEDCLNMRKEGSNLCPLHDAEAVGEPH